MQKKPNTEKKYVVTGTQGNKLRIIMRRDVGRMTKRGAIRYISSKKTLIQIGNSTILQGHDRHVALGDDHVIDGVSRGKMYILGHYIASGLARYFRS